MSNVTFSSPVMARDLTVYAVAGDRGTILAVAKPTKSRSRSTARTASADRASSKSNTLLQTARDTGSR